MWCCMRCYVWCICGVTCASGDGDGLTNPPVTRDVTRGVTCGVTCASGDGDGLTNPPVPRVVTCGVICGVTCASGDGDGLTNPPVPRVVTRGVMCGVTCAPGDGDGLPAGVAATGTHHEPSNSTPMAVNSVPLAPPHVRTMGVHRTCGAWPPNDVKENTHPKNTLLFCTIRCTSSDCTGLAS